MLDLNYFKIEQIRGHNYWQVPKLLLLHEAYSKVDLGAKMLYALFLDRLSLSSLERNRADFTDEKGLLYIIFSTAEIMNTLNISINTVTKFKKQLVNIGLIEIKTQGMGKADLIYVKDYTGVPLTHSIDSPKEDPNEEVVCTEVNTEKQSKSLDNQRFTNIVNQDSQDNKGVIHKNCESRFTEFVNQESQSLGTINTNTIKTDSINTKSSHSPVMSSHEEGLFTDQTKDMTVDLTDKTPLTFDLWEQYVKEQIDYDGLICRNREFQGLGVYDYQMIYDNIVLCIVEVLMSKEDMLWIQQGVKSVNLVQSVYKKLTRKDIEYTADKFVQQQHEITNPGAYIKSILYSARQERGLREVNQESVVQKQYTDHWKGA